jgi:small-conductance mechanosensitive channel
MQSMQDVMNQAVENAESLLKYIVPVVVVIVVVWFVYFLIVRSLMFLYKRKRISGAIIFYLRRILRWAAVLTAIALILQALGVLENAWAAITAILAMIAIGFVAVWSVLSNALCSLMLMVVRPFGIGDSLELPPDDLKGKVVNFTLMFTVLRTENGDLIQIPNNMFFQRVVRRKPGKIDISLDEQLLEEKDAKV